MKKILLILVAGLILISIFAFYYNNNPKVIISFLLKKGGFKQGDLIYRVNLFGIIPVANAVFKAERIEEYNGQKVYHLSATAQSLKIFSKFFSGYAALDSYIDIQTHNPILFKEKTIITDKKAVNKEVLYDHKNGVMNISGVKRQIFPDTQDPLSSIFNIRSMNFDNKKDLEMNMNTNQKNYILKGTAQHKDISVNKKIYKTVFLRADIRRKDKNPYHQSKITMVLLKEKENIPILIKVFASGFLINAKLVDINDRNY